ncbi:hypothetical protein EO98_13625 [Methanosarcina sp. 2.H.T.1A.6]|nr:hypothetical protein EO94_05455 [Methanosarcina sp. 2.H.T.1A.3]KKG19937.1 hypothetical protein EO98_13625 [Methanosarcina sp. 2.H.T.1A.6]KKG22601.1 hypothetical protein EO96_12080 [Methanosarcina sp. 2.H.T.1A.8]
MQKNKVKAGYKQHSNKEKEITNCFLKRIAFYWRILSPTSFSRFERDIFPIPPVLNEIQGLSFKTGKSFPVFTVVFRII